MLITGQCRFWRQNVVMNFYKSLMVIILNLSLSLSPKPEKSYPFFQNECELIMLFLNLILIVTKNINWPFVLLPYKRTIYQTQVLYTFTLLTSMQMCLSAVDIKYTFTVQHHVFPTYTLYSPGLQTSFQQTLCYLYFPVFNQ